MNWREAFMMGIEVARTLLTPVRNLFGLSRLGFRIALLSVTVGFIYSGRIVGSFVASIEGFPVVNSVSVAFALVGFIEISSALVVAILWSLHGNSRTLGFWLAQPVSRLTIATGIRLIPFYAAIVMGLFLALTISMVSAEQMTFLSYAVLCSSAAVVALARGDIALVGARVVSRVFARGSARFASVALLPMALLAVALFAWGDLAWMRYALSQNSQMWMIVPFWFFGAPGVLYGALAEMSGSVVAAVIVAVGAACLAIGIGVTRSIELDKELLTVPLRFGSYSGGPVWMAQLVRMVRSRVVISGLSASLFAQLLFLIFAIRVSVLDISELLAVLLGSLCGAAAMFARGIDSRVGWAWTTPLKPFMWGATYALLGALMVLIPSTVLVTIGGVVLSGEFPIVFLALGVAGASVGSFGGALFRPGGKGAGKEGIALLLVFVFLAGGMDLIVGYAGLSQRSGALLLAAISLPCYPLAGLVELSNWRNGRTVSSLD